jgi:hypothetical protein
MSVSDYITLSVKEKLPQEKCKTKKGEPKVKTCKDCREFKFYSTIDLKKDCFFEVPFVLIFKAILSGFYHTQSAVRTRCFLIRSLQVHIVFVEINLLISI